jgi:hypothetical protein
MGARDRRRTYEQVLVAFVLFALNRSISSSTASALWSFLDPAYEVPLSPNCGVVCCVCGVSWA